MMVRAPLVFDEASHTYTVDGRVLPGVSTILRPIVSFDGIPRDVLELAAARGKVVHKACELDDLNDLDEGSLDPSIVGYVNAWRKFRGELDATVISTETPLYHASMRFAGTRDSLLSIKGERWLVDRKTSDPYPWHGVQLAGYQLLAEDNGERVDRLAGVYLSADGTYRIKQYASVEDLRVFSSLLTVHKWKESNV